MFQKYAQYLKMYTPYVNNYELALATLAKLNKDKQYQEVLTSCVRCKSRAVVAWLLFRRPRLPSRLSRCELPALGLPLVHEAFVGG